MLLPNRLRLSVFLSIALIGLLLASAAHAQILNGTITGTVKDPTDAVVPNASVTVSDLATNQQYKTQSDETGVFTVANLPNGFYKVLVEHPGFAKTEVSSVQVFVSQISRVALKLEVAKTGTEIIVESQAAFVQTESAELKNTIDRAQIMALPLNSRNPMDLVKSFAGIITAGGSGDAFAHGLRGNATNLTQDGINVADNFVKTSAFFAISAPTVDTVGEFNVSVGGIGADAGFGAAQVSIVTQRGSNQFHGSAFWFQRTNELNANTFFNNQAGIARPFQLQQRLGANGGGPVYIPKIYNGKNRTWVFGTYEAYREPLSRGRTRTVLTDSARTGQFQWASGTGGLQSINLLNIGTIGTSGTKPTINADLMGLYNNYVPTAGLTDSGCSNGDGRNVRCFVFNLPGKNITDRYTLRADHQITRKHSASFVFNQADFDSTPDLLNAIEPQFPKSPTGGQGSRRQVVVWAVQSVFGDNKTNEARAGYQRAPVGFNYPYNFSDFGGVQVNTAGSLSNPVLTSTNLPQGRNTPVRQAIDNFSWTKGKHSMRFGGEYRQIVASNYFYNSIIPIVNTGSNTANPDGLSAASFPGGISATDLSHAQWEFDTITGLLGSTSQGFNHTSATSGFVPNSPRLTNPIQHNISGYAQDSWRIKPGLTLQFGTRWEFQGVLDDRKGLVLLPQNATSTLWGPTNPGAFFSTATNGATDSLLTLQGNNNGKPFYGRDWNNFAPFIGLAWDPWKNGKTAIRASFATHYTQDGLTFFGNASTANAGLFTTATNSVPTGVYSIKTNPLPSAPADQIPVSQKNNFAISNTQSLTNFDPNLKTPYILEWSFGIQRELPKRVSIEVRYAANHAVKQYRAWNVNEVNLNNNGLLTEFVNAQNNLSISQAQGKGNNFSNQGLAGQVALPTFDKIFNGIAAASGYGSSSFITNLQQNTIGSMFDTIRRSPTYRANITNSLPLNFFVANPWANSALQYDNSGWSYYDGLEMEINRRMSNGLILTATYTFSKVLADTNFLNSQNEGANYISVLNRRLDKFRAGFDATHSVAGSVVYPLPFGRGKKIFGNINRVANVLVGGWQMTSFSHIASGNPITISSGRVTTGSLLTSTAMIRNMTQQQLQGQIGVFRGANGVYFINPDSGLIKINGSTSTPTMCTAGQTTPCFDNPAPGQIGNTNYNAFSGPHFFGQDASIAKHTRFGPDGRFDVEMRLEMFNVFNTAVFTSPSNSIQSSTFGQLTSVLDTTRAGGVFSRTGQWALRVSF
jgi:hypothetical protein